MQTTKVSLYSMVALSHMVAHGFAVAGYTTRPGFSNGLFLSNRVPPMSGYQGFECFHNKKEG